MRRASWFLVGGLLATACAAQLPPPTDADALRAQARFPGTTVAALAEGRTLYVAHCSGCHRLYRPRDRQADAWPGIVGEMTERAKLSRPEADAIVRYLVTATTSP